MKPIDVSKAQAALARASCSKPRMVLRAADGSEVSKEMRDEMLRRCVAGEYVALELEIDAYYQKAGEQNRNFTRFRDGALMALGRSGRGSPFMRDHDQENALARGGTIHTSSTEKLAEGEYVIRQNVKLTAPWAVELALRELLTTVSIGWNATGPLVCSVCNADFYRCSHFPGERYSMKPMDDGTERAVRDPDGPIVAELIYTSAELVETSAVSVPAVPSAQIEAIRAAAAAHNRGTSPHSEDNVNLKLLSLLGLAATAGANEDNVIAAVDKMKKDWDADKAELQIAKRELDVANKELDVFRTEKRKTDEDKFVSDALAVGKIGLGDEESWRSFYQASSTRAVEAMAKRAPGSATPVGQARQSGAKPPKEDAAATTVDAQILAAGGDPTKVRADLRRDGLSEASIEKQLAAMVSGKAA